MSYLKFYQAQDMDVGLPLVSAPATGSPRGPSWYVMTNGTNTVQLHSPDSGNFTYSGSSLASGAMDAMWVWNGTVTDDAHLAYSVGTGVDPLTYIALRKQGTHSPHKRTCLVVRGPIPGMTTSTRQVP